MTNEQQVFDVAVVGGGVMGAAAAAQVARQGRRTVLFERFQPGHTRGSSHGDGRILRYSYPQPVYAAMAGRAYRGWREAEAAAGETLVENTGGLDLAPVDCGALATLEASLADVGVPCERLGITEIKSRFPALCPPAGVEALYQPNGAVVRANRAVGTFWKLARKAGADLVPDAEVVAIEVNSTGDMSISLADGRRWRGERVIIAAGGWTGSLLASMDLVLPLQVTQECLIYLPPRAGSPPHGIGHLPTIIDYHDDVNHFYALPQIDVPGVKVGRHRTGPVIDPEADRVDSPELRKDIIAWIARYLPHLEPDPIAESTCLYTNTPDFDFIIDHHPRWPQVVVGAGFSGHGFKFAPVIGEMLAAMALDQPSPVSREAFRIDRFG